jgi:hypothetical protein
MGCAVAGLAAFFIAYGAAPAPPPDPNAWRPPPSVVDTDVGTPPR